ncbi:hypothetical protein [Luteimonas huabeiensis]|uniref:hypothetical protein n=1 Tax=Luteimonas huabeiensis TaxID=1244513 RepID=UPI00046662AB|nr:hypothetical protein [Luteimonas huabeiensis]
MTVHTGARTGPGPAHETTARPWLFVGIVALCAIFVRLVYVQLFSSPMPFWDQWDGEADHVLRPWIEGHFGMEHLLRAHNEHRILPTKLVTIVLYELTGRWSNMDEARLSACIYGLIPAMLLWSATVGSYGGRPTLVHKALAALIFLFSVLPFSWENTLVGFQSQFYFMLAASIAAVILAARHHSNVLAAGGIFLLSAFACLTMASGLITPLVAACVLAMACVFLPGRRWPAAVTSVLLLAMAIAAYATTPQIPQHQILRPKTAIAVLDALNHLLGWPITGYHWAMFYLWLPAPVALTWRAAHKTVTRTDLVMAGLYGWSLVQALAIGAGRGEGLVEVPSRYVELLIPGLFANAWFALSMLAGCFREPWRTRIPAATLSVAFFAVLIGGLLARTPADFQQLRTRSEALAVQQSNTLRYLRSNDPAALDVPFFALPYPDHTRLKALLDNHSIRQALGWTSPLPPPSAEPEDAPAGS